MRHGMYALRQLARNWKYALIVSTLVMLGAGANAAATTVLYTAVARPLNFERPERLFFIWGRTEGQPEARTVATAREVLAWREAISRVGRLGAVESCASSRAACVDFIAANGAVSPVTAAVSIGFFDVIGIQPVTGARASGSEPGTQEVYLSNEFWRRQFGGETGEVGRRVRLRSLTGGSDNDYTVAGILPAGFSLGETQNPDVWVLAEWTSVAASPPDALRYYAVARLGEGGSSGALRHILHAASSRLTAEAIGYRERSAWIESSIARYAPTSLHPSILVGGLGLSVLALACATIANLCVSRCWERRYEFAVRAVLGATPTANAVTAGIEGATLCLVGGTAAIGVAAAGLWMLRATLPEGFVRTSELQLDAWVLSFTVFGTFVVAFLGCALPLSTAVSRHPETDLRTRSSIGSRPIRLWARWSTRIQLAAATALVVVSSDMLFALGNARRADLGFRGDDVYVASIRLNPRDFGGPEALLNANRFLVERVRAVPGVKRVAIGSSIPLGGTEMSWMLNELGAGPEGGDLKPVRVRIVTSQYLSMLGIRLVRGESFGEEHSGRPVAIISEAASRQLFAHGSPIGRELRLSIGARKTRIIGVAQDTRESFSRASVIPTIYVLAGFHPFVSPEVLIDTGGAFVGHRVLSHAITSVYRNTTPKLDTVAGIRARALNDTGFYTAAVTACAAVALLVALMSLYVGSQRNLSARRREVGMLFALGAERLQVLVLVVRELAVDVGLGATLGVVTGILGISLLSSPNRPADLSAGPALPWLVVAGVLLVTMSLISTAIMRMLGESPATLLRDT